jgi:hypothetical protein
MLKQIVKRLAIFSGDVDRELGYKYVPVTANTGACEQRSTELADHIQLQDYDSQG